MKKTEARDSNINVGAITVWMALKLVNSGASTDGETKRTKWWFGVLHCSEARRMRKNQVV